jgi:hypothetical protein
VAGRQGGGREINECYSETKTTTTTTKKAWELGNATWRPEKDHFDPEVRAANEMTCDCVWDKLLFCNLL